MPPDKQERVTLWVCKNCGHNAGFYHSPIRTCSARTEPPVFCQYEVRTFTPESENWKEAYEDEKWRAEKAESELRELRETIVASLHALTLISPDQPKTRPKRAKKATEILSDALATTPEEDTNV